VLIAGVGVWAVFQMAFAIAGATGRSLNGDGNKAKADSITTSEGSSNTVDSDKAPKIASPLEKIAVHASLRRWRERQNIGGVGVPIIADLGSSFSIR
jgi:hypothetical protein